MFAADETGGRTAAGPQFCRATLFEWAPMEGDATPRAKPPWGYELRSRIAAALEKFIGECDRQQLIPAFSSNRVHLVIDEHYQVYIAHSEAIPPGSVSAPLGELE